MGVISWIIIGLLAGWLAARITAAPQGLFRNIAVGLIGAVVGGWLARQFGIAVMPSFWAELLTAIIGAVILLAVWQAIRRA